ncbi:hypothetical protein JS84_03920 [Vibrio vulnificus]|uniref:hypothetical protein n=2 Tax=Vibrio vulnificus TaxID=672 RepID=UPI00034D4DCA|nr:hypothetical protein [Vibrio vulnificus]EWS69324.1 hypothetical protein Y702_09710 [Vibrio vulnificus BAA87]KFK65867.1 hypothetical protein JS84_03920 [Vibrio vulnificus]KFK69506.1 hypothetical protein JS85_08715 [Vibrio vulnificus]NHE87619.1 hypothetical protein [Vibrio vulnificus]POC49240.1 hypothetical protein CRN45_13535 [Vibrio vulnificus]
MEVKELGQLTNFTVSAIDEITGEEMPVLVSVLNDLSRVVISFKAIQIGATFKCLSLRKLAAFGDYSLVISEKEYMPEITFSVTLIEDDFFALSEHPLLSEHLSVNDLDNLDSPMMQRLEEGL